MSTPAITTAKADASRYRRHALALMRRGHAASQVLGEVVDVALLAGSSPDDAVRLAMEAMHGTISRAWRDEVGRREAAESALRFSLKVLRVRAHDDRGWARVLRRLDGDPRIGPAPAWMAD